MAYQTTSIYREKVYNEDARHKLKILFNGVEYPNIDNVCEKLTINSRIIPNGNTSFALDNFISKEATLILHNVALEDIVDPVEIQIGTLTGSDSLGDIYEYVPIGIFNIQDIPTTDKDKTTITLRDNAIKFDFPYNAEPLIEGNGGSATKMQIFQDICTQADVGTNVSHFLKDDELFGGYDNNISGRQYIAYLAEQAGAIAIINRYGNLDFIYLNNLEEQELPLQFVESYQNGDPLEISKVIYESGVIKYECGNETHDTLFLDASNPYINDQDVMLETNGEEIIIKDNKSNFQIFKKDGKCEQITYTGKNLLKFSNGTYSNNGITAVANNGEIVVTGTCTGGNSFIRLALTQKALNNNYTLSFNAINRGTAFIAGQYTRLENTAMYILLYPNSYNDKYVSGAINGTIGYIDIRTPLGTVCNYTIKPQLEQGTVATSYEPYVGGIPSPNPSYPQTINTVKCKNLFDINAPLINGYISSNGTYMTGKNNILTDYFIKLDTNTSYTLSVNNNISTLAIAIYGESKNFITRSTVSSGKAITINSGETYKYIKVFFNKDTTTVMTRELLESLNPQLEKGSVATKYVPYNNLEIKVTGKNMYNQDLFIVGQGLDGNTGNLYVNTQRTTTNFIEIKQNTNYYSSGCFIKAYAYYDNFKTRIGGTGGTDSNNVLLTSPINAKYVRIAFDNTQNYTSLQLEQGSISTEYEAYKETSTLIDLGTNELCSLGDVKDELIIENNRMKINKKIDKVVLDGTESWYASGTHTIKCTKANLGITNMAMPSSYEKAKALCNINVIETASDLYNGVKKVGFGIDSTGAFYFSNNDILLSDFKTYLSNNNAIVYYELNEPQEIDLGEIEVQNFEGYNYIYTNDNIKSNMYIKYTSTKPQIEFIYDILNGFKINSFKTGKILGNPAIDPYDIISVTDGDNTYKTLATNTLTYNGKLIQTFDTQVKIGDKQSNVSLMGEPAFQKYAKTNIDNINNNLTMVVVQQNETTQQMSQVIQTVNSIQNTFQVTGGNNLIKDSQGLLGDDVWTKQDGGTYLLGYDADLIGKTIASSKLGISNGKMTSTSENITGLVVGMQYTLSYKISNDANTTTKVKLTGNNVVYDDTISNEIEFIEKSFSFIADTSTYVLEIESSTSMNGFGYIYDLMLNKGDALSWEPASGEIVGTVLKMSQLGLQINCTGSDIATLMTSQGFQIKRYSNGTLYEVITEFTSSGLKTKKAEMTELIINNFEWKQIRYQGNDTLILYKKESD